MRFFPHSVAWLALSLVVTILSAQKIEQADDGTLRIAVNQPVVPVPIPASPVTAQAINSIITPAPVIQNNVVDGGSDGDLTIAVTNSYGQPLSLAFEVNAGSSSFRGAPQPTSLGETAVSSYAAPSGWAGRISVGRIDHVDNSKIEGSFYGAGNGDIDISYVDGYSVPVTCSVGGKVVTGCNIELFDQGCNSPDVPSEIGPDGKPAVCSNGARANAWGPASSFFAPCTGAAYTFPNDNDANTGMIKDTQISCCIGISCDASPHQRNERRNARSIKANSPSLLPRSRKSHAHHHGQSWVHRWKHGV